MATYLNPGNSEFRGLIEDDIYVDKTGLLSYTNGRIGKAGQYICVSRPRGFGKTYAADMLAAYYSHGCDSRDLFENLKIAQDPSFETHLNKYDVLFINMKDFISAERTVSEGMELMAKAVGAELKKYSPDAEFVVEEIPFMLADVYEKTGVPFVVIIDEYDAPIRERKDDKKGQRIYLDFLTCLLKDEAYVTLAYVTGILPVKKMGESGPNMFDEYTMIDPGPVGEFFGFTENEVKELSERYGVPFENLRGWYGAYDVWGAPIYNPWSVTKALEHNDFNGYWTKTAPYEELKGYINENRYGLHDVIVRLLMGDTYPVDPEMSADDPETQACLDDILTLLVHLGYLTYDDATGRVRIPNLEVRKEFLKTIAHMDPSPLAFLISDSEDLLDVTLRRDEKAVAEGVAKMHDSYHETPRKYNSEDELEAVVRFAYIAAINYYDVESEPPAGKGYADLVFTPVSEGEVPAMVIELEAGRPASGAIAQIKERRYVDRLGPYRGEVYLVGISYDVNTKVHECLIEVVER